MAVERRAVADAHDRAALRFDRLALDAVDARLRASVLHQRSTDMVAQFGTLILTTGVPYVTPSNSGNSRAAGVELGANGTFETNWRWDLNARYASVTDRFSATGGGVLLPFALSGQHLLHRHQRQTSAAPVERRVLVSLTMQR